MCSIDAFHSYLDIFCICHAWHPLWCWPEMQMKACLGRHRDTCVKQAGPTWSLSVGDVCYYTASCYNAYCFLALFKDVHAWCLAAWTGGYLMHMFFVRVM